MKDNIYSTQEYYIVYFDILGYKAFFEDKESDIQSFLTSNISIAQDTVSTMNKTKQSELNLRYKLFSDNCIILLRCGTIGEKEALLFLANMIAQLQLRFLREYSIPIRGAITKGDCYINSEIVFGNGLIKATELENKRAVYPRIIIDSKSIHIPSVYQNIDLIAEDDDGQYYVDYFSLLKVGDLYSPDKQEKSDVCVVRDKVFELVTKYGHFRKDLVDENKIETQERVIRKYLWLIIKYNKAVEKRKLPVRISFTPKINEKYMRIEIVDVKKGMWPVVGN